MVLFAILLLLVLPVIIFVLASSKGWKSWVLVLFFTLLFGFWAENTEDHGKLADDLTVIILQVLPLFGAIVGLTLSAVLLIWRKVFSPTNKPA